MGDWFKDWFASKDYLEVYKHRNMQDADSVIHLILENIELKKNSKILDAACGAGRHSFLLKKSGYQVVGFDLSKTLLNVARENSRKGNIQLDLVNADIRNISFDTKFNLIINLFTSFGYFISDEENFAFVNHSYKFMAAGGYYVFDYLNKDQVINNLVPHSEKKIGDRIITEIREINNGRVNKLIRIKDDSGDKEFQESVRLYSEKEICSGFSQAGYKEIVRFGDYNGNPFSKNSERLIIIFQK